MLREILQILACFSVLNVSDSLHIARDSYRRPLTDHSPENSRHLIGINNGEGGILNDESSDGNFDESKIIRMSTSNDPRINVIAYGTLSSRAGNINGDRINKMNPSDIDPDIMIGGDRSKPMQLSSLASSPSVLSSSKKLKMISETDIERIPDDSGRSINGNRRNLDIVGISNDGKLSHDDDDDDDEDSNNRKVLMDPHLSRMSLASLHSNNIISGRHLKNPLYMKENSVNKYNIIDGNKYTHYLNNRNENIPDISSIMDMEMFPLADRTAAAVGTDLGELFQNSRNLDAENINHSKLDNRLEQSQHKMYLFPPHQQQQQQQQQQLQQKHDQQHHLHQQQVQQQNAHAQNQEKHQQQQQQQQQQQLQQQMHQSKRSSSAPLIGGSGIPNIPQVTHSIASQLMLRSPRGQRQYDVPQIECPPAMDGMERFACPTPDIQGRYRCIDDHVLCDGFIDCPEGEDEDRQACMFYKTTKAHLDVLADALLRWARGR